MKHRFPRLLLALLLCAALLTPTFALAEEIDMEPIEECDRYTFYNDGTQWTLYSIERGTPVEATAA